MCKSNEKIILLLCGQYHYRGGVLNTDTSIIQSVQVHYTKKRRYLQWTSSLMRGEITDRNQLRHRS